MDVIALDRDAHVGQLAVARGARCGAKASNDCDAHTENMAACVTVANTNAGARLTPSLRTTAEQPPASVSSCAPLE